MDSYGHAAGDVFLVAAPFALLAFVAVLFIREVALRTTAGAAAPAAESPVAENVVDLASARATVDATAVVPIDPESPASTPVPARTVTTLPRRGSRHPGRHEAGRHEATRRGARRKAEHDATFDRP